MDVLLISIAAKDEYIVKGIMTMRGMTALQRVGRQQKARALLKKLGPRQRPACLVVGTMAEGVSLPKTISGLRRSYPTIPIFALTIQPPEKYDDYLYAGATQVFHRFKEQSALGDHIAKAVTDAA